jgi:hypothetical protein
MALICSALFPSISTFETPPQGKKCARCRQAIQSDPAFADQLWFHRACLDEGTHALQRDQQLAAGFGRARTSVRYDAQELQRG